MGFIDLVAETRSSLSQSFSMKNPPEIFKNIFGGIDTKAGVKVDEGTALSLTAVWACVLIISRTMGVFPLPVYKRLTPRGKERAPEHPLYKVLHDKPNDYMTSFIWRMITSIHQNLWGAGISEIEFDSKGNPVALWPIPPWRVEPVKTQGNNDLIYEVTLPDGRIKKFWPWQLLIFPFFPTIDGGWLSPVGVHRETIGSALAVREFGARTFGNGVNPAGIVSGVVWGEEDTEATLRKKFAGYEGLGQSHRLMFLEEGQKFDKVGLPPEDAQYLETRKYDTAEVARMYTVPLFMLQEHEKSTSWGTGLGEMKEGFITFTMQPYCAMWEQEFNTKLFDNDQYYTKFQMDGLLRSNIKDRALAYKIFSSLGMFDIDDMLELEDRNPLPNGLGKARLVPMNMQTLETAVNGGNDAE
jgi:HK97 family phage portal protein